MLRPHAYRPAVTARSCGFGLVRHRSGQRRVEMGGREGRHALLGSTRAGCDQDRECEQATSRRMPFRGRRGCRAAARTSPGAAASGAGAPIIATSRSGGPRTTRSFRIPPGRSTSRSASSRRCGRCTRSNLYLDGKVVTGFPRNALSYALSGIPRGTHNVTATVTDQRGKQLQATKAGRVHRAAGIDRAAACRSVAAPAAQAAAHWREQGPHDAAELRRVERRTSGNRSGDQSAGREEVRAETRQALRRVG